MNEAELLFSELLHCDRPTLYLNKGKRLDKKISSLVSAVLKRRISGEPIDYILGKTEFMGLQFKVGPQVFIPRPETEILVETACRIVGRLPHLPVCRLRILDIGTGSGNIAISMAKNLPHCKIDAIDISQAILKIALANAKLNKVKINFMQSDLFNFGHPISRSYDLILSNPPYIASGDIEKLERGLSYEPRRALEAGEDGLDFYRQIISAAPAYLREKGYLIMEMGFDQAEAVKNIFQGKGFFEIIEIAKDYLGLERVIVARKKSPDG